MAVVVALDPVRSSYTVCELPGFKTLDLTTRAIKNNSQVRQWIGTSVTESRDTDQQQCGKIIRSIGQSRIGVAVEVWGGVYWPLEQLEQELDTESIDALVLYPSKLMNSLDAPELGSGGSIDPLSRLEFDHEEFFQTNQHIDEVWSQRVTLAEEPIEVKLCWSDLQIALLSIQEIEREQYGNGFAVIGPDDRERIQTRLANVDAKKTTRIVLVVPAQNQKLVIATIVVGNFTSQLYYVVVDMTQNPDEEDDYATCQDTTTILETVRSTMELVRRPKTALATFGPGVTLADVVGIIHAMATMDHSVISVDYACGMTRIEHSAILDTLSSHTVVMGQAGIRLIQRQAERGVDEAYDVMVAEYLQEEDQDANADDFLVNLQTYVLDLFTHAKVAPRREYIKALASDAFNAVSVVFAQEVQEEWVSHILKRLVGVMSTGRFHGVRETAAEQLHNDIVQHRKEFLQEKKQMREASERQSIKLPETTSEVNKTPLLIKTMESTLRTLFSDTNITIDEAREVLKKNQRKTIKALMAPPYGITKQRAGRAYSRLLRSLPELADKPVD